MRKISIIAASVALSIGSAQAGEFVGHGVASCATWIEHQRADEWSGLVDEAWLAGYLSAYNTWVDGKIMLPDAAARRDWISTYCRGHPLDPIYTAADRLLGQVMIRQQAAH